MEAGYTRDETAEAVAAREEQVVRFRPVTIVNASERKRLELRVEVPVEDMAQVGSDRRPAERPGIAGAEAHFDLAARSIRGCWRLCASGRRR